MSTKTNYSRVGHSLYLWDTNTLPKQMVTYLKVNIVYQEIYHLANKGFIILHLHHLHRTCETHSYTEMFDLPTCVSCPSATDEGWMYTVLKNH